MSDSQKRGRLYNSGRNAFYSVMNKIIMTILAFVSRKVFLMVLST